MHARVHKVVHATPDPMERELFHVSRWQGLLHSDGSEAVGNGAVAGRHPRQNHRCVSEPRIGNKTDQ